MKAEHDDWRCLFPRESRAKDVIVSSKTVIRKLHMCICCIPVRCIIPSLQRWLSSFVFRSPCVHKLFLHVCAAVAVIDARHNGMTISAERAVCVVDSLACRAHLLRRQRKETARKRTLATSSSTCPWHTRANARRLLAGAPWLRQAVHVFLAYKCTRKKKLVLIV